MTFKPGDTGRTRDGRGEYEVIRLRSKAVVVYHMQVKIRHPEATDGAWVVKSYTQDGRYVHGLDLGHPLDLMKDEAK